MIGFSFKVVERAGSTLKSKFPQSRLWDGMQCGRSECIICNQGAKFLAPYMRKCVAYENICGKCNEGARGMVDIVGAKPDDQFRRGEQNTGQPAGGTRNRKMGATFTSIWNSNTKGKNLTLC